MEKRIVLLVIALCFGGAFSQDPPEEEPEPIEAAACVFGCLEAFQRKGVQGDTGDLPSLELEGNVCEKLDLNSLVGMCSSYQKAGTCLGGCVNSPTKKIVTSGLEYICVNRMEDFKKHMPCFKQKCTALEHQCGPSCGMDLAKAQEQWLEQLGVNGSEANPEPRHALDASSIVTPTTESTDGSGGAEEGVQALDTCQFVRCYINCSRPIVENECGKDAYDLLKHTSNILLSFVMAPLEETWESVTNTTFSDTMSTCDRYFSQALTDEGVDRSVLKSATSRPSCSVISTALLVSAALVLVFRF